MKVLITADIHIGHYPHEHHSGQFLEQYSKLAEQLVEMTKEKGVSEIWILGDFLRVPNPDPTYMYAVRDFIQTLTQEVEVRFILGNHDLAAKSDTADFKSSLIGLFEDNDMFTYMHHQIIECDGHTFGFMDWSPGQGTDWIDEKVDVLLGHYTRPAMGAMFGGQEIDSSKFDMMIYGDIHQAFQETCGGKRYISVGTPFQLNYSGDVKGHVVMLDTATLEVEHIETDPFHTRYITMLYTPNEMEAGWMNELTFYTYKPGLTKMESATVDTSDLDWSDIKELSSQIAEQNEVKDIHEQISATYSDDKEIDFNFKLKSLDIVGYRSVTNFHIDFGEKDRILLLGHNGSGKSSIINALRAAFDKGRNIKDDKSDLCDTCQITVEFWYKNKIIRITKGDSYGHYIDGEQVNYNNKTAFENDLIERYPFIQYLDLFFIAATSTNLSMQLDDSRRVDLISKFYRLERLEAMADKAMELREGIANTTRDLFTKKSETEGSINILKRREVELLPVDGKDKAVFQEVLDKVKAMYEQREKFNEWKVQRAKLESEVGVLTNIVQQKTTEVIDNEDELREQVSKMEEERSKLHEAVVKFEGYLLRLTAYDKVIDPILRKGQELKRQIESLERGICPTCGQLTKNSPKSQENLNQMRIEKKDLADKYTEHRQAIADIPEEYITNRDSLMTIIQKLKSEDRDRELSVQLLSNKIQNNEVAKKSLAQNCASLDKAKTSLKNLEDERPEEPEITNATEELRHAAEMAIIKIDELAQVRSDLEEWTKKLEEIQTNIASNEEVIERYDKYILMMSSSGSVMEEILKTLAAKFSTDEIKYEINSGVSRGKQFLKFVAKFKVGNTWRTYSQLSSGQKQIVDVHFLNSLFVTPIGMLCLDEFLGNLDASRFDECSELLKGINVNTLIIATHNPNLTIQNKLIRVSLGADGVSKISIE